MDELQSFSVALESMKQEGTKWAREGWNAGGMWVTIQRPDEHSKMGLPYFYIFTTSFKLVPWIASQSDLIADDWFQCGVAD